MLTKLRTIFRKRDHEAEAAEMEAFGDHFVEHHSEPKQRTKPQDKQRAPSKNK